MGHNISLNNMEKPELTLKFDREFLKGYRNYKIDNVLKDKGSIMYIMMFYLSL